MNWSSDYLVVFPTDVADTIQGQHVSTARVVGDISPFGNVCLSLKLVDTPSDTLLPLFGGDVAAYHRILYISRRLNFGLDISNCLHIDTSLFRISRGLLFETSQSGELRFELGFLSFVLFYLSLELHFGRVGFKPFDAGRFNLFDFAFEDIQSSLLDVGEHIFPFRDIEDPAFAFFGLKLIYPIDILLIEDAQSDILPPGAIIRRQLYLPFVDLLFEPELARIGISQFICELILIVADFGDFVHIDTSHIDIF